MKICGLTTVEDAWSAATAGADFLGFIFHPASPRHLTLDQYRSMAAALPALPKVAVIVEPTREELARLWQAGFERIQLHCRFETPLDHLQAWSAATGVDRLWLAPKLPPAEELPPHWLPLARTFLLDAYHAEKFGGTGQTGDWEKFRRLQAQHAQHDWILSGGLTPDNLAAAIAATDARFIDVNSGVESAPGKKDGAKLRALNAALEKIS